MPGLTRQTAWRDEYVFAITAKDPSAIKVAPAGSVKISNRITAAEGYLGELLMYFTQLTFRQLCSVARDCLGGA